MHKSNDNGGRITEFFAATACDLTPASAGSVVCVLFAPASPDPQLTSQCASVLSAAERGRAERFVAESDRARFIQRRAFRRYCGAAALESSRSLARVVFEQTEKGQPYLRERAQMWFSFSSSRFGYLGAWSSTHRIGVDLEDQSRNLGAVELARTFFSPAEADAVEGTAGIERLRTFYQLWTLKEAALKSIGEGLPFGLDAFEFELRPKLRIVRTPRRRGNLQRYSAHRIETIDGCGALVMRSLARDGGCPGEAGH